MYTSDGYEGSSPSTTAKEINNMNHSSNPFIRYEQAPIQNGNSSVLGVSLYPNEEVSWHYTYINGQQSITGYTITNKFNIVSGADKYE